MNLTTPHHFGRVWHYFRHSLLGAMTDWAFLSFVVVMPVSLYLFFAAIYGDEETAGGVKVAAAMMVTMAAYGGLGAAMNAGGMIQAERASGWVRQLMITPLRPGEFIVAKLATAVGVVVPALVAVFVAGAIRGVRLEAATWLAVLVALLFSLLPMVILGVVIGMWAKPQTASVITTLTMLVLSMVGGLWFPLEMMPGSLQLLGRALPSCWVGKIGQWPVVGGDFPWRGVVVIGAWTLGLIAAGAVSYGRAVRTSRR